MLFRSYLFDPHDESLTAMMRGPKSRPLAEKLHLPSNIPIAQTPFPIRNMYLTVRAAGDPTAVASAIQRTVRTLDSALPVVRLRTMDEVFGESVSRPRFLTMLLGIFGGLALVLAAVGTYGVLSYLVSQRSQEIGIRMALGADRTAMLVLVLRQGLILAGVGLVLGVAGAMAAGRLMRTLLFNVSPLDPMTLGAVTIVMTVVALFACLVPALRATRVDPLTTLQQ